MSQLTFLWAQNRHKMRAVLLLALTFVAGLGVLLYLVVGSFNSLYLALTLYVGVPIGLLVGLLEVYVIPRLLVNMPLGVRIAVSALLQLLLVGLMVGQAFRFLEAVHHAVGYWARRLQLELPGSGLSQLTNHPEKIPLARVLVLYGLLSTTITLAYQTARKIGVPALVRLLLGYYNQPVEEKRLFLFVDLQGSTTLAEQLGNLRYSAFVRDFFHDVGAPIAAARGEIYQYVGDEVVVTWLWPKGLRDARCLRCFFAMQRAVDERREHYLRCYGVVPFFKGGLHGGAVIATQVGDIRSELVFHGDVLNTTARIEAKCNALQTRLLLSATLYNALPHPREFHFRPLGDYPLRGKASAVGLYAVDLLPDSF